MKVLKRGISILISFCLVFSLMVTAHCDSFDGQQISLQGTQIEYLISVGVPQSYLERRTPDEISFLFELAQTHTLQHFSVSTSYCENDYATFGTIPTSDMTFTVDCVAAFSLSLPNQPSRLDCVAVTIDYRWHSGHPLVRFEDAITVEWDSTLFQFNGDAFNSVDYHHMGSGPAPVNRQFRPAKLSQGGLGYYANLFNTSTNPVLYSGSASFLLDARENMYATSEYPSNMKRSLVTAEYTHNKNPLGIGLSFSDNGFNISVAPGALQDSAGASCPITYSVP